MYFVLFILFLVFVVMALLAVGIIPAKCTSDYDSPLNFVMFQEPKNKYSDQLVNQWVDKPWRSDGKRIPSRIEHGYRSDVPLAERKLVLYSHGNAEDLLNCVQFIRELSSSIGMDVVCWDYSGYGLNELDKFERTPEGINLSLQTLLDHLIQKGYKLENIILWGYSLGSGPSVHLASILCQRGTPPAGVVLFGAYSSILDVVKDATNEKVASMFHERWNSKELIGNITCPILLMHGQSDGLIRYHHAEKLKEKNPNARLVLLPNTGHTRFSWGEAIKEVRRWLTDQELSSAQA